MCSARRPAGFVPLALALLCVAPAAPAGPRDVDALARERRAYPGTLETIVGKFARHTDAFYEWRAADRRSQLRLHRAGELDLTDERRAAAYDDLATALDKLGRREEALDVLDEKAAELPGVGLYETAANRGTILVHLGRYEDGLAEIERASELNPDARSGRERIQELLIEYLIERRGGAAAAPAPLDPDARAADPGGAGFAGFLKGRGVSADEGREGVAGMLRSGDFRSPALLEALGDLLLADGAARRLAARAYLAAGRSAPDAAPAYRELAAAALSTQREDAEGVTVERVSAALDREFAETAVWFAKLAKDEALWIASSPDPEARFREKYGPAVLTVGDLNGRPAKIQEQWSADARHWPLDAAVGVGGALTLAAIWALIAWRKRSPTGWDAPAE